MKELFDTLKIGCIVSRALLPCLTKVLRMERAIGDEAMALVRTQLDLWTRSGLADVIEEWRRRQVARMFSLSEFVRCVKLRFCLLRRQIGRAHV